MYRLGMSFPVVIMRCLDPLGTMVNQSLLENKWTFL